jgi:hypothetical protein
MRSTLSMLAATLIVSTVLGPVARAQSPSILGKTDIRSLLEAVPGLPNSPAEAAKRQQSSALYEPFYQRTAVAHEVIKQAIASRTKGMPDQATLEKQAKAQSNSNPIVAGMGGIDNIQQMTPEQRKAAARKSMAAFQQNLVIGGGRNSPAMQAMMQRVMTDPEYRARFQKMSEQEQEAELGKNMGTLAPPTAEQHQKAQQSMAAGKETATALAIRSELAQMGQRIAEVDLEFTKKDQAISTSKGSHEEISREISTKMAKVPVVELGEYGHDRDPEQMMALAVEQATRDRERSAFELKQRATLYAQHEAQYKEMASAYDTWLKQNLVRINTSVEDPLSGHNTELAVIGYEDGLIRLAENLAKYTEETTRDAAHFENEYQEKISNRSSSASTSPTKPKK